MEDIVSKKVAVVLTGPEDWDEWIVLLNSRADGWGIRHLLYPDENGQKPEQPIEPLYPSFKEVAQEKDRLVDLTAKELDLFRFMTSQYEKHDLPKFHRTQAALNKVRDHVLTSISRPLLQRLEDGQDTYDILEALRTRVAPTDRARRLELSRKLQRLSRITKNTDIMVWIDHWQYTHDAAARINLPAVADGLGLELFLTAVRGYDAPFAAARESRIQECLAENRELPTVSRIVEEFRNTVRLDKATVSGGGPAIRAAFGTLRGESDNNQNESQGQEEQEPQRPARSEKRSCICGTGDHRFNKCLHLNECLRPAGFTVDKKAQAKIKKRLEAAPGLQRVIERAKKEARERVDKSKQKKRNEDEDQQKDDRPAFACAAFAAGGTAQTPNLQNCWILDSGTNIHVTNSRKSFVTERLGGPDDIMFSGRDRYQIEAFGTVDINTTTPSGPARFRLLSVALVPGFFANLVCLRRITEKGVHWDTQKGVLHQDGETICTVGSIGDHWVLNDSSLAGSPAISFATSKQRAEASLWHARIGHPGPEPLAHLAAASEDVEVEGIGPRTNECEACALSKAHQLISRSSYKEVPATQPFMRVSYDLIPMKTAFNGDQWVSHMSCEVTTADFVYCHREKRGALAVIREFLFFVWNQYRITVRFFRTDGERALGNAFSELMKSVGIAVERSAVDTPEQNGAAERSGALLIMKARALRIGSGLPSVYWPEIVKSAAFLSNRTPKKQLSWKSPFEALHGTKPHLSFLRCYGCRAYPVDKKVPKGAKLEPRALIGYLVGFEGTNIYRIWVPSSGRIIRSRDVSFNEELFYDERIKDAGLREPAVIEVIEIPSELREISELPVPDSEDVQEGHLGAESAENEGQQGQQDQQEQQDEEPSNADVDTEPSVFYNARPMMITPEETPEPLDSSTTGADVDKEDADVLPERSKRMRRAPQKYGGSAVAVKSTDLSPYVSFYGSVQWAYLSSPSLFAFASSTTSRAHHRDQLPAEPRGWRQMLSSSFKKEWMAAATVEIEELQKRGTYELVDKEERTQMPLPLIWVFKYKLDLNGFLVKFKARICVRGDLQQTEQETYAATLAARAFRALMAISAAFDLEIRQYDAVNAFINADIDDEIYCSCPQGFAQPDKQWKLRKALYGLKQAPLLWYQTLTEGLLKLGLKPVPGVECLYANHWLLLFFYVDDVVVCFSPGQRTRFQSFEKELLQTFSMRSMGDLRWFLGIRVVRDRAERRLWLCQDSYITRIAARFGLLEGRQRVFSSPLPSEGVPPPPSSSSSESQIKDFQQRVGSINFAAVISRPDVAFAASRLSQHLRNPSQQHLLLADRVISYLYQTQWLALEYSYGPHNPAFSCSSDAAFADDEATRRSSHGYLFSLYGGPVDWKAARQPTVTTSSTEAELLGLSSAVREALWWRRFFYAIEFDTEQRLVVFCDNQQTLRLLTNPANKLSTKLRHVDIHNHWLRQTVGNRDVELQWVPTAEMPADGLTKALPGQKHSTFIRHLNLVDISSRVSTDVVRMH